MTNRPARIKRNKKPFFLLYRNTAFRRQCLRFQYEIKSMDEFSGAHGGGASQTRVSCVAPLNSDVSNRLKKASMTGLATGFRRFRVFLTIRAISTNERRYVGTDIGTFKDKFRECTRPRGHPRGGFEA